MVCLTILSLRSQSLIYDGGFSLPIAEGGLSATLSGSQATRRAAFLEALVQITSCSGMQSYLAQVRRCPT